MATITLDNPNGGLIFVEISVGDSGELLGYPEAVVKAIRPFTVLDAFSTTAGGGLSIRRYDDGRYSMYFPFDQGEAFFPEEDLEKEMEYFKSERMRHFGW